MNIKAIIVEDEFRVRQVITKLLQQHCPSITVLGEAENIFIAYNLIVKHKPDVIFLDIEMPGGNGFELLAKFKEISFETIFVTSFGHYAINAIKHSALDYLLKPIIVDELKQAVEKIIAKAGEKQFTEQYKILRENLDPKNHSQKLVVINKRKIYHIETKDISYLEGDGNYSNIFLTNGDKHIVTRTLKDYEEILCSEASSFVRVHKSYIVNIQQINHVEKGEDNIVVLHNNVKLEISRRKRQDLLSRLNLS